MDTPINFVTVIEEHIAAHPEAQLYFLLDHAGLPGLLRKLDSCRMQWISLFEGTRESAALSAAPILVFAGRQGTPLPRLFLEWIGQHGAYASAVTLLDSPLAIDVLHRRLVARLDIRLSENMSMMLRFFDPRVLAQLRTTLMAEQASAFFSVASHWWYIDRAGVLVDFDSVVMSIDASCIPLVLSQKQEFALVDASEADQVLAQLHRIVPNLMGGIPLSERYEVVVKNIIAARKKGLTSHHDFTVHVVEESTYSKTSQRK
jgi:hypothetical protein